MYLYKRGKTRKGQMVPISRVYGGGGVYEQRRVDLATFRAVPASTWEHCPQVLVFTIVWDSPGKERVAKWSSAPPGFNEIYAVCGPKKPYKTREKRQSCQIDPCLPPCGGGVSQEGGLNAFFRGISFCQDSERRLKRLTF